MQITSQKYGPIRLAPMDADSVTGLRLPGSRVLFSQNDLGTITIQQLKAERYSIRYSVFNFDKHIALLLEEETAAVGSRFILKGNIGVKVPKASKKNLKQGQFLLYSSQEGNQTIYFENGKEYRLFDSAYSFELLQPLLETFHSLEEFIHNRGSAKETIRLKKPHPASPEMTKIVYDLLRSPYDENLRKIYFENKVNDFLFELLAQTYQNTALPGHLTQAENVAVFAAKALILNDISKHLTIKEISRQVQLNEFKLKTGFKQVFGMGLFECLLQSRMEKARELLLQTDKPMKEIAAITGFEFLTNFIAAFRKYFGYTPGELKRKS